jgi:2-amino-4-hydroxy-6-hydroxymethyldihydropteridine diphosphokinase
MSTRALIALGSNLGDRATHLADATASLAAIDGTRVVAASRIEETLPLGGLEQPAYLNQMLLVETTADPRTLLRLCHDIERTQGRERAARWTSRTLDLDLIRYGDVLCDLPELSLPHPGLRDRPFWAREIAELEAHG